MSLYYDSVMEVPILSSSTRSAESLVHGQLYYSTCTTPSQSGAIMNSQTVLILLSGIVLAVCFAFSLVGLVLNFVFICRKKTNFQVRLFSYLTAVFTLTLGVLSVQF